MTLPDETFEIGYMEDGIFWLTASTCLADPRAAERSLGPEWVVVEEVHLGPTGRWVNNKDPEWEECAPDEAEARLGWRLVNTDMREIYDGDWIENPHYRAPRAGREG